MSEFLELIAFIRKEINHSINKLPIPDSPAYLYDPIKYAFKRKREEVETYFNSLSW